MNFASSMQTQSITAAPFTWSGMGRRLAALVAQLRRGRPRQLRLCESLPLGERRFVAVVEFQQQKFLIGGSGGSLCLLTVLPRGDEAANPSSSEAP
jgi:flagellar biogenesis protein FliO